MIPKRRVVLTFLILALVPCAVSQEFRATVRGRVTDPQGLPIPGVGVTAANLNTNETYTAVTGDQGNYTIPFVKPGLYSINAEFSGFKKFTRDKVELSVGQTAAIDIALEVGQVSETVTVSSEAPLLETDKSDRGAVIERTRVSELPLNARNPFMLGMLVAGVNFNGAAIYHRPFDNGAIADWNINGGLNRGGSGGNEFLLDGAPNNSIQGGNNLAYVPPVDAVEEFKIMTNTYDAQYGRTSGGIVNVSLKSGTNRLHGNIYEFARRDWLDANYLLTNAQHKPTPAQPRPARSGHYLDQYGFQLDGPVYIPKIYDGRNKTFFMYNFENYGEGTPNPATLTYPDALQKQGDFSKLVDRNGNLVRIYDPATGRANPSAPGGWVRDPFPDNKIPESRINPVAKKILSFYPAPNLTPDPGSDPWRNNFALSPNIATDSFHNHAVKIDQVIGDKDRMFFRYGYNTRTETRYTTGVFEGPAAAGQLPLERINYTGVVDWVHTFSPRVLLNVRIAGNRYIELARADPGLGYDSTQLGFPKSLVDQLPVKMFPVFNASDYTVLGRGAFTKEPTNAISFQPNLAWIKGVHSIRAGLDMRMTQYSRQVSGNAGMQFTFNRGYTQRVWNQGDALSGNSIASMLLGAPASGNVDNNVFPIYLWPYYSPWIQDDWKVSRKLTLNLGLRWDFSGPPRERFDSMNVGFFPDTVNPISSSIGMEVKGGIGFAGVNGQPRIPWEWDKKAIQPRVGAAYSWDSKTVVRGGVGLYYTNPTGVGYTNGFSIQTPYVASIDGGRTPLANLADPYPGGVATPPGSSLGLKTFLGRGPSYSNVGFALPGVWQFSLGIQRQLPWQLKLEASYVGSRIRQEQDSWGGINEPPDSLRKQCDPTRGGVVAYCNELLKNPFYNIPGFEGTGRYTSPTLSRYELSRPFPQFTGFTESERNEGRTWYNSMQIAAEKRATRSLTMVGTYTLAKMIEENGYIDDILKIKQRSVYPQDRPHRLTISGVYYLPFGKGQEFLSGAPYWLNLLAGGWELGGLFVYNSGRPWGLPTGTWMLRDPKHPDPNANPGSGIIQGVTPCVSQMANDGKVTMLGYSVAAGCTEPYFIIRPSYTQRVLPNRSGQIRRPSFREFDTNLAKNIRITEGLNLQLRLEIFNVTNTAVYDEREYTNDPLNTEFGRINKNVTRQNNFPRFMQLGAKLVF